MTAAQRESLVARAIGYAKSHDGQDWSADAALNHLAQEFQDMDPGDRYAIKQAIIRREGR